jgi:hypothetical protein
MIVDFESPLIGRSEEIRNRAKNWLIAWGGSGSSWGRVAERSARQVVRVVQRLRSKTTQRVDSDVLVSQRLTAHTKSLKTLLQQQWSSHPIEEIVVFDLFDLPAALDFGAEFAIPVRLG